MSNINNKECNNCKASFSPYAYKGQNGTFLCGGHWKKDYKCGYNVCFTCGKQENRTEMVESEDCCGNKRMVESRVEMFQQFEKDSYDNKLYVHYCDEHKDEAQNSPLKWTKEDEEKLIKKEAEKEVQEEQKAREKISDDKNLFYYLARSEQKDGQRFMCFIGKKNNQEYYLMIPDKLVWESANRSVAEELDLGGKGLFFIYGTENFPIQKISSNCWENLSKSATELTFHKIVGLNNKIAFGIYQDDNENPEKDSPTENQSNNKFSKSQIAQYFYSNNIKSITLKEDGNLIVQYNGHEEKWTVKVNTNELQQIKFYCQQKGLNTLSFSDLQAQTQNPRGFNWKSPWVMGGGIVLVLGMIGLIVYFMNKNKKKE